MIATCVPRYSPRQMSAVPPESSAMLPRFLSPTERMAEVGSCSIALLTFPKAVTNFAFFELMVGYAFVEMMRGRFQREETDCLVIRTWSIFSTSFVRSPGVSSRTFRNNSPLVNKRATCCLDSSGVKLLFKKSWIAAFELRGTATALVVLVMVRDLLRAGGRREEGGVGRPFL